MINADMRDYSYYLYVGENDYGQPKLSDDIQGSIKMAIDTTTQSIQDNINYSGAQYLGLTLNAINDKYVIQYGDIKLKVLYVNPKGRYKQAYMAVI